MDEDQRPGRFIVTGSHNLLLMKSVARTLAGRTAVLTLHPFSLAELRGRENIDPANLDRIDATGWTPPARGLWETLVTGFYPYIHETRRPWNGIRCAAVCSSRSWSRSSSSTSPPCDATRRCLTGATPPATRSTC